ncbi:MAG TPA: TlpA disulfide reductase family protein [Solirubrobacterales bacterium]|nr:TlpA disulfide reductase family protein [Solirubrobacterales bacterium]
MSARSLTAFLAVLAVIGLLGFGLLQKGDSGLDQGATVPDEPLPLLAGGGASSVRDYRGKWVLVNFWASWCDPCRAESPDLAAFHRANRARHFTVLGIDTQDLSGDGRDFVRAYGLEYPHLRDPDGDAAEAWGTTGVPETFLVDPRGRLRLARRGPVDEEYLAREVEPLLPGAPG